MNYDLWILRIMLFIFNVIKNTLVTEKLTIKTKCIFKKLQGVVWVKHCRFVYIEVVLSTNRIEYTYIWYCKLYRAHHGKRIVVFKFKLLGKYKVHRHYTRSIIREAINFIFIDIAHCINKNKKNVGIFHRIGSFLKCMFAGAPWSCKLRQWTPNTIYTVRESTNTVFNYFIRVV